MRTTVVLAALLAAAPAAVGSAQSPAPSRSPVTPEIRADIEVPGEADRVILVTVRSGGIEGCYTSASRICTRTRRIELTAAQRRELDALLARIRAMPLCEPVGFEPGDPAFSLTIGERVARGHLPSRVADVPSRTDEPCEAEHALAWWIVERFGGR